MFSVSYSAVPFNQYLLSSIAGSLPALLLFCQLGSAGKAGLDAVASGQVSGGIGHIVLLAMSVIATLGVIALLPRFARKGFRALRGRQSRNTPRSRSRPRRSFSLDNDFSGLIVRLYAL
jgi:uncharacterized membrane protein YdjX (TVP38/TMEM64 family)